MITINDRCTDLTIIHQGNVRLVRSLPVGSMNLLDALGEKPLFDDRTDRITEGQKERKKAEDVPPEEQSFDPFGGGFSATPFGATSRYEGSEKVGFTRLENIIVDLADETLNTIRYGQSFGKEQSEVHYAIINGYFPFKDRFITSLRDRLGLDVYPGNPFSEMNLDSPALDEELLQNFPYNFTAACGLALRGVGEHE